MSRVIVVGIDGFDPEIYKELQRQKKLPHLAQLAKIGSFTPLATANPAQSPVVWASIATGTNPGNHGLYDFITRDPHTYLPHLAITKPNPKNMLGLRSRQFLASHQGVPFWSIASKHGIPTTILKWPVSFPPDITADTLLSGLGVPDVAGTLGRYTLITNQKNAPGIDPKGVVIPVSSFEDATITLSGPDQTSMTVKLTMHDKSITCRFGKESITIRQSTWSNWIPVMFQKTFGRQFPAMCKVYFAIKGKIQTVYISSLHIDPQQPLFQISHPDSYATELATAIGRYHTLGLPEETNGLQDEYLSHDAFLLHVNEVQTERERIFWHAFNQSRSGIFSFVFDTLDRVQHMFWFTRDKQHPRYNPKIAQQYRSIISDFYIRMDTIIGTLLKQSNRTDMLLVLSDHGFNTFRRAVHINRLLISHGFMKIKTNTEGRELFADVDWDNTIAYAVGFSSIYLNRKGREKYGIVNTKDVQKYSKQIREKLLKTKDTQNNKNVFSNMYLRDTIYSGTYCHQAPDIVIGTNEGYRVSWQTAVGAAPIETLEDNDRNWSGDHLIDPQFVSGVLFTNQKIIKKSPTVYDIAPTILSALHIPIPQKMEGKPLV